jgi:aminoglycoside 6'-N-acetyltransferase I
MMQIEARMDSSDSMWLALRFALWPDVSEAEHLSGMAAAFAHDHYIRLALNAHGSAVGFVEASKRVDYVNGTSSSPRPFSTAYVAPRFRFR